MLAEPVLTDRTEHGRRLPLLVWRLGTPLRAISSAPLGGGIGVRRWVVNATVPMSYDRDDPDVHLTGLAAGQGLTGSGVGLLTGADVTEVVARTDEGVQVWATVGLGAPIWAAAPSATPAPSATAAPSATTAPCATPAPSATAAPSATPAPSARVGTVDRVGTVNIVAFVPAPLADAALVNAVLTVTEAKAQALRDLALPATGTATDTVTVLCPLGDPPEAYGGPRSRWGAPLARAAWAAVRDGGAAPCVPWSARQGH